MKKLYIIHNDLDGIGNYVLIKYYNLQYDDLISMGYEDYDVHENKIKEYTKDDTIVFVDFAPNENYMNLIEHNNINCIVYDHHSSVYELLKNWKYDKFTYFYEETLSGTAIFYKNDSNFVKKSKIVQDFVTLVSTYDTYNKKSELWIEAENLNRLLFKLIRYQDDTLHKYDTFLKSMFYKFDNLQDFSFSSFEKTKIQEDIKKEKNMYFELINGGSRTIKTRIDKEGNYFCIIKLTSKISSISNMLLEKYKKVQYVICINDYNSDLKLSLRSREGFSLLNFENVKGHERSAGYVNVTNELCNNLWKGTIYCLTKIKK